MPEIQESVLASLSDDLANSFFESGVSSENIILPSEDSIEETNKPTDKTKTKDKQNGFKNPIIEFDTSDLIEGLDLDEHPEDDLVTEDKKKPGRPPKVSSEIDFDLSPLFADETLRPFEDEAPVKTLDDLKELILGNREAALTEAKEKVLEDYKSAFPESVKLILDYVENGGQDFDNFLKAVGKTRQITDLDVEKDTKEIIRQYYSLQDYTPQEIDEEIESLLDLGEDKLKQTAARLKPRLDKMQDELVNQQLEQTKEIQRQQQQAQQFFVKNVVDTLKKGSLGDIKISKDEQSDIYKALIEERYQTANGGVTNRLGALLDKIQFIEPDYALLAKITMYASDPQGFEKKIREEIKKEVAAATVRQIKQNQGNNKASGHADASPNKIKRLNNTFINPFV